MEENVEIKIMANSCGENVETTIKSNCVGKNGRNKKISRIHGEKKVEICTKVEYAEEEKAMPHLTTSTNYLQNSFNSTQNVKKLIL